MKAVARTFRHLCASEFTLRRCFGAAVLDRIEQAIRRCEAGQQAGEVRFAIEAGLSLSALWHRQTPRARAVEVFGELGVWDTEQNDGVLIYVLLADHDVEIVADRGLRQVPQEDWDACCRVMESHFAAGRFAEGAVAGIEAVAAVLARRASGDDAGRDNGGGKPRDNELPDAPVLL